MPRRGEERELELARLHPVEQFADRVADEPGVRAVCLAGQLPQSGELVGLEGNGYTVHGGERSITPRDVKYFRYSIGLGHS
jgi:hypothetical protein